MNNQELYDIMMAKAMEIIGIEKQKKQEEDRKSIGSDFLQEKLKVVRCQEDNIKLLIKGLRRWNAQSEKKAPVSFFLVGTSGVGKTYTVEVLAEALKTRGYRYVYFAMSEFQEKHSVSKLVGSPPGYVGSDATPKLIEENNLSKKLVLCFDEIEKAHPDIITALMQLLEKGFLSATVKGKTVEGDFRNCIICFTSNAIMKNLVDLKRQFIKEKKRTDNTNFNNAVAQMLIAANIIRPELKRRISRFLVYNPLSADAIIEIAFQEISKASKNYGLEVGFVSPEILCHIAEDTAGDTGGVGPIKQLIDDLLSDDLIDFKEIHQGVPSICILLEGSEFKVVDSNTINNILSYDDMIQRARQLLENKTISDGFSPEGGEIQPENEEFAPILGDCCLIDSNIWMNGNYHKSLPTLARLYMQKKKTITLLGSQFDEIINIRDRYKKSKNTQNENFKAAQRGVKIIEKLQSQGIVRITNLKATPNKKAYADPDLINYAITYLRNNKKICIITNDIELRARIRHMGNEVNKKLISVLEGNDLNKISIEIYNKLNPYLLDVTILTVQNKPFKNKTVEILFSDGEQILPRTNSEGRIKMKLPFPNGKIKFKRKTIYEGDWNIKEVKFKYYV